MSDRRSYHGSGSKKEGPREGDYIVHKGRQPGIYKSWPEAKEQVDKYPNNCHEKVKPPDNRRYVVYKGRNPGVYPNWKEAQEQVGGYPDNIFEKMKGDKEARKRFEDYQNQSYGSSNSYDGYSSSD